MLVATERRLAAEWISRSLYHRNYCVDLVADLRNDSIDQGRRAIDVVARLRVPRSKYRYDYSNAPQHVRDRAGLALVLLMVIPVSLSVVNRALRAGDDPYAIADTLLSSIPVTTLNF